MVFLMWFGSHPISIVKRLKQRDILTPDSTTGQKSIVYPVHKSSPKIAPRENDGKALEALGLNTGEGLKQPSERDKASQKTWFLPLSAKRIE